ncbi:MAG: polysaccharide deacetylase family protein [bacterium]
MKLKVGISEILPEWKLILQQIGISFSKADITKTIPQNEYAVLIVSTKNAVKNKKNILHYLHNGGSLLIEADIAKQLLDEKIKHVHIKYLYSDKTFLTAIPCDLHRKSSVASHAQHVEDQRGRKSIAVKKADKGTALILPVELLSSLLNYKIQRKKFPSEFEDRNPSERVSKVSKEAIFYLIHNCLQYLFHIRNLPFIHLWFFPDGAKSQFSFRVDTDFSSKQEVKNLYQVCRKNSVPATWFVEVKSQANWINIYREMENQEIGYHCYRHRIYPTLEENRKDFKQGLHIIKQFDIKPKGYAAPYGEWNPTLAQVAEEFGFKYSSEFGLAYDEIPFFPYLGKSFSRVLQIPIHPISVGSLRRARHTRENILNYYLKIMEVKRAVYQPIIFYHHPLHGYFDVFDIIFQNVMQKNIPVISLGKYSDWWRKRNEITWDAEFIDEKLYLHSFNTDSSVWIRASLSNGDQFLHPLTEASQVLQKGYTLEKKENLYHYNIKQLRKKNLRMLVYDIEHYLGKLKR